MVNRSKTRLQSLSTKRCATTWMGRMKKKKNSLRNCWRLTNFTIRQLHLRRNRSPNLGLTRAKKISSSSFSRIYKRTKKRSRSARQVWWTCRETTKLYSMCAGNLFTTSRSCSEWKRSAFAKRTLSRKGLRCFLTFKKQQSEQGA